MQFYSSMNHKIKENMKTRDLLFPLLALCFVGCSPEEPEEELRLALDSETFLDDGFRTYLEVNFDTDGNGFLDEEEILAVDTIDCSFMGIRIISHLEKFVNLRYLNCSYNELACLDVSGNPVLETLDCNRQERVLGSGYSSVYYWNRPFDLRLLPGFDVNRAYDWSGGTVEGTMLTTRSIEVRYSYRTGKSGCDMYVRIRMSHWMS